MYTEEKQKLLSIAREMYGRLAWTHKTYEKNREIVLRKSRRDKWVNVILMGFTTTGVVASIPLDKQWIVVISAVLSFLSTAFAVYQISFPHESEIQSYRQAAKELLAERDKLLLTIEKIMSSDSNIKEIRELLESTNERIQRIYSISPDTTSRAYKLATKALKFNEELTFSDREIDQLLPSNLRLDGR